MKRFVAPVLFVVLTLVLVGSVAAKGGPVSGGPSFGVTLSGAAEPSGGDPTGSGTALITLDSAAGAICVEASYAIGSLPVTGAHIHRGVAGEDGPIVVGFVGGGGDLPRPTTNSFAGCTQVEAGLLQSIAENPSGYYFNIHDGDFPGGAIRGQLAP
ncbi:MAG TPA: CHRD domain-containing protein [Chloroflexota bacterium]|nr:CHRD domain-containing protein [Chloroflexota bacterium]